MTLDTAWARAWMTDTKAVIARNREYLIDLDRQIGDGDHGENLDRGFTAVERALGESSPEGIGDVLKLVAKTLMSTVGGAAGPLYGTAFLRAAKAAPTGEAGAQDVVAMVAAALEGIQARGKAERGEKTMVDAWGPALDAAREAADGGATPVEVLVAASQAASAGAQATIPMQATKGRASYLGARSVGHLDPGAVSSSLILDSAARVASEEA